MRSRQHPRIRKEACTSGQVAANVDQITYWNGEPPNTGLNTSSAPTGCSSPFVTRFVEAVRPHTPRSVLDVECGWGHDVPRDT
jgi:hypothetical protein